MNRSCKVIQIENLDARRDGVAVVQEGGQVMLRLWGEHDLATVGLLRTALAEVLERADDVVVDLREVTFLGSSTMKTLAIGRDLLAERGHTLLVRSPTLRQRRLLEICDLADLIEPGPAAISA